MTLPWPWVERFAPLEGLGCRHGFFGRVPGVEVTVERTEALARLEAWHDRARVALGLGGQAFVTAEQVHGREVAVLREGEPLPAGPVAGVDGLVTDRRDVCLGIYVADCGAVYLADPVSAALGLVHAGRKGTELGIVPAAVQAMERAFGTKPEDLVAVLSPCIRPPWYEVDFAARIGEQVRQAGVGRFWDAGVCTAAQPDRYYSYRREMGRTGRMLAVLAWE